MKKIFFKAEFLPSFTDKKQNGTIKLHFRRRTKAESYELLIINADDFLVNFTSEQNQD
jgi:hypothetical protein